MEIRRNLVMGLLSGLFMVLFCCERRRRRRRRRELRSPLCALLGTFIPLSHCRLPLGLHGPLALWWLAVLPVQSPWPACHLAARLSDLQAKGAEGDLGGAELNAFNSVPHAHRRSGWLPHVAGRRGVSEGLLCCSVCYIQKSRPGLAIPYM